MKEFFFMLEIASGSFLFSSSLLTYAFDHEVLFIFLPRRSFTFFKQ